MRFTRPLGVTVLMVLGWIGPANALASGSLEGRIVKDGQGVGGVTVIVNETKTVQISEADGSFVIDPLPVGTYTLLLTLGENTLTRPGVAITEGQATALEIAVDWEVGVFERVTVTAAAKRAEKIVDAPAAITTIDAEDIEREASHGQLPKVLEYTPGAEVTQSGLYDFNFNTRGFNSSLNRRVSTYIDGRDVGVPLLGAQEWAALSIPLDDLAGLEFIRGPSAALYGANASSGVINMTTKAPRESQGGMLRMSLGELSTVSVDFRRAGQLGKSWYYKVIGGIRDSGDFSVSRDIFPEYSTFCVNVGDQNCLQQERKLPRQDNNQIQFGTVRLDKYFRGDSRLTLETAVTDVEGPVFQTGIGRVQIDHARRPYARVAYNHEHWNVTAHWAKREGNQINLAEALEADFNLTSDTIRYSVEAQTNWSFDDGDGRFVIGGAHTKEKIDSTDPVTGKQTIVFKEIESDRQAIFTQLDWRANEHLLLVFAGRVDQNTLHDTQFSPKAGLVWNINPRHSLRFTFNRAFQVANYSEFFLETRISVFPLFTFANLVCNPGGGFPPIDCGIDDNVPILAVGNDDLKLEKTEAFEVGYAAILGKRAFVTLDYYSSDNKNFITDLLPQINTSLGTPINPDYSVWVGPDEAENTIFFGDITYAQAIRNFVDQSIGSLPLGGQLANDFNGDPVVVLRTYGNLGEVKTQGYDVGIQWFINGAWATQASYSWFDFDVPNPDLQTLLLPNSPEHKASLSVSFKKKNWEASISGRWVDDFLWSAGVFAGPVPSYSATDLAVTYMHHDRIKFGLNVANVLDDPTRQTFGGDFLSRRALTNVTFYW